MLMEARPNYGWLGEESGEEAGKDPTRRWIVDPLDGTTNFLHGLPHWAISIALEHKGDIVAGVIYDPVKDEMFTAEAGQGAWLNDRRLRVSARRELSTMLFGTGLPFGGRRGLPEMLGELGRMLPRTAGVRRWGTASLDLAYVAAGRFDGFWERGAQTLGHRRRHDPGARGGRPRRHDRRDHRDAGPDAHGRHHRGKPRRLRPSRPAAGAGGGRVLSLPGTPMRLVFSLSVSRLARIPCEAGG